MSNNSIAKRARDFRSRAYLARWFPNSVTHDDSPLTFGETELGIIERVFSYIEGYRSVLIHNPVPSDRLALGIVLAYVRSQDPRFPEQGIVGQNNSVLAFPAHHKGYVSTLDELREDSPGRSSRLLDRETADKLSEVGDEADLYTANSNFVFDQNEPSGDIGLVFVDLRKPEWGDIGRRFGELLTLRDEISRPMVLYTDETTAATERIAEEIPTLSVTNELLATADTAELTENPSRLNRFEHLINSHDIDVEQINVVSQAMNRIIPDLTAMRDEIQRSQGMERVITMEVGWLYNLLTRLPAQPEYWDRAVESNYYQQGVRELLENLRGKARRMEGRESNVLINYCQAADELHGRLNTEHPLQEAVFELITEDADIETTRTIVVNSEFERKAILQAITLEDRRLSDDVSIDTVDEVEPSADGEYIVVRPLDTDSFVYDFPIGTRVAFLQFDLWDSMIENRLQEGIQQVGASLEKRTIGETEARPPQDRAARASPPSGASYEPVEDASMEDVDETLQDEFESGDGGPAAGSGSSSNSSNPDIAVTLSTGDTREWTDRARVSVLKSNGDIGRKEASELRKGETVLLLDSVADDIYDMFIESAHQKEQIRKSESVVERWRSILKERLAEDLTEEELLAELRERGSEISDPSTISTWRTGEAIGPRDPEDVRRVLAVLKPEMKPTTEATVDAMKHIRRRHQEIGKEARRAIERQMGGSIASSVATDLPGDIDVGSQDVRKATVEGITAL